ncbi:MAG: GH116 family glycosyl hydrolase [Chloroflexota bacterium]
MRFVLGHWDTDGDGVPDGRQHDTYDIELYGPNPLSAIYVLAAVRAWEELARVMGDDAVAMEARAWFLRASARTDALLWDGEYFVQRIEDVDAHRYQHGRGCLSDQLLGQLHARLLDLGDLLPPEHVRSAIAAVYRHNLRRDFRDHVNAQRTYVLNDEAGLVLCSWPKDGRPRLPFVYSDEVWTGIEYQVASHLIAEGSWTRASSWCAPSTRVTTASAGTPGTRWSAATTTSGACPAGRSCWPSPVPRPT